jgi:radical SAM-linked protein
MVRQSAQRQARGFSDSQVMRHRWRIRFRKQGDLRWISHRDLARVWERMFRRAELPLAMSEGFHPKARLSFPSALSLGVAGTDEVLEAELTAELEDEVVLGLLRREAPPGLTVDSIERMPPGLKKAQVVRMTYEVPVPAERLSAVERAVADLLAQEAVWVTRSDRSTPVDLRAGLEQLALREDRLVITLLAAREASARPRDVLAQVGLADLESTGTTLTRTRVELA